jgi:hypothetical protein
MMEAFWVMAFVLLWLVVLPVAGLVKIGLEISGKIDNTTPGTSSSG